MNVNYKKSRKSHVPMSNPKTNKWIYSPLLNADRNMSIKTNRGRQRIYGLSPEMYKCIVDKKCVGFTPLIKKDKQISLISMVVWLDNSVVDFPVYQKPTNRIYMYVSVGNGRYIGIEKAGFKNLMKNFFKKI